ncbi:hypothetical protein YPPY93_4586, partial [Yersinia pestis PY-93]
MLASADVAVTAQ